MYNQSTRFIIKNFSIQPYLPMLQAMQKFTAMRNKNTHDEVWLVEHQPVFTLGQAAILEDVIDAHDIPVIKTDRGGQVTYHGFGQLMVYCLFDIKRLGLNIRQFVCALEQIIINLLSEFNVEGRGNRNAPGVYVNGKKIAALGLRLRKGYSYHGLCFNINVDLTPFTYINPCGIKNQPVTSLKALGYDVTINDIYRQLTKNIQHVFNYK